MNSKEELLKQLKSIEEAELLEKDRQTKAKNFEKFMQRCPDFMVGKAHCELDFINKKYASDRDQVIMPECVSVSGNMGRTYYPRAEVTDGTKTYYHNVWQDSERLNFQKELNELAYKYVDLVRNNLKSTLELMGLQSLHYYVSNRYFLEEDLPKVKHEIEKSQAEILDNFPDEDFVKLMRHKVWTNEETGEREESHRLDLSHSQTICKTYLANYRPSLYSSLFDSH